MKSFLVIYHAPNEAVQQFSNATPEEITEATKPWMEWKSKNDEAVVDFGSRLTNGQERSANIEWNGSSKEVTGFSILQGESIEEVKTKLNFHPQLSWNPECKVGIYEFFGM